MKALEAILGVKSEYMGLPTFAYRIGRVMVDRTGSVIEEGESAEAFQNLTLALSLRGFEPESVLEQNGVMVNGASINEAPTQDADSNDVTLLEIQMPADMFTDKMIENLKRIIHAKGDLIKKAIDMDTLPLNIESETIGFPWFPIKGDADEVEHHDKFIEALCRMAIYQKRVIAKAMKSKNEKYNFRCFFLRRGFIGDEHKAFMRYYMRNLSGNAVFKRVE